MKTTIKLFGTIAILSMFMACSERQQDGEYETSLFSVKQMANGDMSITKGNT